MHARAASQAHDADKRQSQPGLRCDADPSAARTSRLRFALLAVRLMMAASMSSSPGRKKIMKLAAVPPIMCRTAPRSVTTSEVASVEPTKLMVSRLDTQRGMLLMLSVESSRSCVQSGLLPLHGTACETE